MSLYEHLQVKVNPDLGSLQDERDLAKAASIVARGGIIGCYNGGVCALWGDGRNPQFATKMLSIKGAERVPLFGLTLPTAKFVDMVDEDKIPERYRPLFTIPEYLTLLGSLAFVRVPAKIEVLGELKVPDCFISTDKATGNPVVQNWGPEGSPAAESFVRALGYHGVDLPGISSMNRTKDPEIVSKRKGKNFARRQEDIGHFLTDEQSHGGIKGSYTIVGIGIGKHPESISLLRDGSIPGEVLSSMLDEPIVSGAETIKPKFAQRHFPDRATKGNDAWARRATLLRYLRHVHARRVF